MNRYVKITVLVAAVMLACTAGVHAVDIVTVTVGNPGNTGENSGEGEPGGWGPDRICGAVDYVYNIGKFEVTAGEYTEFLNAVADEDTYGLYDLNMWTSNLGCKIGRTGSSPNYSYSVDVDWADRPVNYVSWGDAARFANWLHNGQPSGAQGPGTTEDGSYALSGVTSNAGLLLIVRRPDATWVIPSEDEWYKSAYYDGESGAYYDYPTGSDIVPVHEACPGGSNSANYSIAPPGEPSGYTIGSPYYRNEVGCYVLSTSPYGVFDQAANVWEWDEAVIGTARGFRGGSFYSYDFYMHAAYRHYYGGPAYQDHDMGFRVAYVLPSTDCNGNGIRDICDIDCQVAADECNVPGCGGSDDSDGNGRPDECCPLEVTPLSEAPLVPKNRYLSFTIAEAGQEQAVQVMFVALPGYAYATGRTAWVQEPVAVTESPGSTDDLPLPTHLAANLGCEPYYTDWSALGTIDVYDAGIVPGASYEIRAIAEGCDTANTANYSYALSVDTSVTGDIVGNDLVPAPPSPPQGVVDFNDISALVDKFKNTDGAPRKARTDIVNSSAEQPLPDHKIDFVDISHCVDAFRTREVPLPGPPAIDPCE